MLLTAGDDIGPRPNLVEASLDSLALMKDPDENLAILATIRARVAFIAVNGTR